MGCGKAKPLTKRQLKMLKEKLEEQKESLVFRDKVDLSDLGLNGESSADEQDQVRADQESSHMLRFRNREVFYAKKLDQALKSIEKNEYGLCVECDSPIKFERLMARPTANMCILCKEEAERDEQANFFGRQSKSYAKTLDIRALGR